MKGLLTIIGLVLVVCAGVYICMSTSRNADNSGFEPITIAPIEVENILTETIEVESILTENIIH